MKLVPVGEKIVVKRLDAEEKTSGGIVLPDWPKKGPGKAGCYRLATVNCCQTALGPHIKSAKAIAFCSATTPALK